MEQFDELITTAATQHGVDPRLLRAVIAQESAWNQWAYRYEPAFYRKYIEGKTGLPGEHPNYRIVSLRSELTARATSWGLCQIMGQVAREAGFDRDFLTELLNPALNVPLGAAILARHLRRYDGDVRRALLRWNGGANKRYPDEVLARIT